MVNIRLSGNKDDILKFKSILDKLFRMTGYDIAYCSRIKEDKKTVNFNRLYIDVNTEKGSDHIE